MRLNRLILFGIVAAAVRSLPALANGIEEGWDTYTAAVASIEVNGDAADWADIQFLGNVKFRAENGKLVLFEEYAGGHWSGPDDHSSAVAFAWESDALYLGVVVTDDSHQHASAAAWNGDGVQVVFANAARDTVTHLYNFALYDDGRVIADHERGPGPYEAAVKRAGSVTTYEARFTPASLGVDRFRSGQKLGIGVCVNDGDKEEPGQKGWSGWGPHAAVFGKTASETGLVTLTGSPGDGDDGWTGQLTLIGEGASWQYLDNGSNQSAAWSKLGFDDSGWKTGKAPFGYGDGDETTQIDFGANANAKHVTTYFRRVFMVNRHDTIPALSLQLLRDDGAVVYLNGQEILRDNMPASPVAIGHQTQASSVVDGHDEHHFYPFEIDPAGLIEGANLLAVEVHQANRTSSDLRFDLKLVAHGGDTEEEAEPAPLQLLGPGVNAADFRVTRFATGLDFPLGMQALADGSLLVVVSEPSGGGDSFWNSRGKLVRLVDADGDGHADGPAKTLYGGLPSAQTSLRVAGNLVLVTGQGKNRPITILRLGENPAAPLTLAGRIRINYPGGGWWHPHSAMAFRATPGQPDAIDLFFQAGSDSNYAVTKKTATLSSDIGVRGTLRGDSVYRVTLTDRGGKVTGSNLTRIATGLRNAAGFAIHPETGDLYLQDNGIDGFSDSNEPHSADELNIIPAAQIGGKIEDFGFPFSHVRYRTGRVVGGGIQPWVAFQPLPDPKTGAEAEGPNDICFAPPEFPEGLNHGLFVGFHGRFNYAGSGNEENPLVYVDLETGNYFHFIGVDEPGVGHLDGLLATRDSLFVADLTTRGNVSKGAGGGVIYQIKSLASSGPMTLQITRNGDGIELAWEHGELQEASRLAGPWADLEDATSPHPVSAGSSQRFFRLKAH